METPCSHGRDFEQDRLPTGLSVLETPPVDKDIFGRWKPEGSDTYARSYGGRRVARLQFAFAAFAHDTNHYDILDEREIANGFGDWLTAGDKLGEPAATSLAALA